MFEYCSIVSLFLDGTGTPYQSQVSTKNFNKTDNREKYVQESRQPVFEVEPQAKIMENREQASVAQCAKALLSLLHLASHHCGSSSILDRAQPICVKVCQLLAVGWWFPPGTPASSTSETDIIHHYHHLDMTLAVAEALSPNKPNQTLNSQNQLQYNGRQQLICLRQDIAMDKS